MKKALLVIDVQNDYFQNGKMPLKNPLKALEIINQLEFFFKEKKLPVIYIQHIKKNKGADFFEFNTDGVRLHPDLMVTKESIIVEKHFPNSFQETTLSEVLVALGVEQVVVCGMMTHMCIDSTTRASFELGYRPILIQDATATKSLENNGVEVPAELVQASFLAALTNFSRVVMSSDFIAQTDS
ncbi:cysteine hydrolase [Latilactobacillus curvatus]|uniref:Cysteine hydrolase n=1 Tax=Latilactobacillus curvatus TaxID=28038 RepID=A0AAC9UN25_LATCU|nr:cysteine hydrolase family protein [Latilactobacillus curvatus]ASN59224.1 cysteine hydrolase [Latilactobacillus curvatus]